MLKAFLFPGQGSQHVGMGKVLYDSYDYIKEIYQTATDILGFNLIEISFYDKYNKLDQTQFTQPAIFMHSIVVDWLLKKKNIKPNAVAGHSLGEISALVSANVLKFEDALKIVKIRANAMFNASNTSPGIMAAVIGANKKQINVLCDQDGIVVPANYNSPNQIVISGEVNAVNSAIASAKKMGIKRIIKLNVSGAFHSPLMNSVKKPLLNIIDSTNFNNSLVPIYQNISANPVIKASTIKINLIKQLENPVLWLQTILNMKKIGISKFIEVGPGNVLMGLNKKIYPKSITYNYNKIEDIFNCEML